MNIIAEHENLVCVAMERRMFDALRTALEHPAHAELVERDAPSPPLVPPPPLVALSPPAPPLSPPHTNSDDTTSDTDVEEDMPIIKVIHKRRAPAPTPAILATIEKFPVSDALAAVPRAIVWRNYQNCSRQARKKYEQLGHIARKLANGQYDVALCPREWALMVEELALRAKIVSLSDRIESGKWRRAVLEANPMHDMRRHVRVLLNTRLLA